MVFTMLSYIYIYIYKLLISPYLGVYREGNPSSPFHRNDDSTPTRLRLRTSAQVVTGKYPSPGNHEGIDGFFFVQMTFPKNPQLDPSIKEGLEALFFSLGGGGFGVLNFLQFF